ncbi:MAG TPA: hypothetical protein VK363_09605 [Pyrinomonadaceae bacterium]|nr:hypothetical protein [Pyrinomonadaceae bacterium]
MQTFFAVSGAVGDRHAYAVARVERDQGFGFDALAGFRPGVMTNGNFRFLVNIESLL